MSTAAVWTGDVGWSWFVLLVVTSAVFMTAALGVVAIVRAASDRPQPPFDMVELTDGHDGEDQDIDEARRLVAIR